MIWLTDKPQHIVVNLYKYLYRYCIDSEGETQNQVIRVVVRAPLSAPLHLRGCLSQRTVETTVRQLERVDHCGFSAQVFSSSVERNV